MNGRPWTQREDLLLREMYPTEGATCVKAMTRRSRAAVYRRARDLGVGHLPLTPEERQQHKRAWRKKNQAKLTAKLRATRKRRRRAGLCHACTRPSLPGYTRCQVHVDACRASTNAKRAARIVLGLCGPCGKRPPKPGGTVCQKCQDRVDRWRRLHRAGKGRR